MKMSSNIDKTIDKVVANAHEKVLNEEKLKNVSTVTKGRASKIKKRSHESIDGSRSEPDIEEMREMIFDLEDELILIQQDNEEKDKCIKDLRTEFDDLREFVNKNIPKTQNEGTMDFASAITSSPATVNGCSSSISLNSRQINILSKEQEEINKRKSNIIIFGVEGSKSDNIDQTKKDDEKAIHDIFDTIKIEKTNIKSFVRFSKKDDKIPGILIKLDPSFDRQRILTASRTLNEGKFTNKIYINKDMTETQRKFEYELRLEQRQKNNELIEGDTFFYGRRGDKLIKKDKTTKKPVD